jgi:hypothetical protein
LEKRREERSQYTETREEKGDEYDKEEEGG